MSRRVTFLVFLAVLCVACAKPRVDTTTDDSLKQSLDRVRASLPESRRPAFDASLSTIFASEIDFSELIAGSAGVASMQASMKQALNGKTGEEVIAYADELKRQREAKEREQAFREIKELETKQAQAAQAKQHLSDFSVIRSRFYKTTQGFLGEQPVIELTVKNGTATAVSRAYFKGTLSSLGRSVPWLSEDFNYSIAGGLEPGETATWRLSPNMFSPWGRADAPPGAVLTVDVVSLDGPDGKPFFDAESFSQHDAERLRELQEKYKP